jgi:hypothetical protein
MGLRLSISEAQQKKLINESEAQEMRRQQSVGRSVDSRPQKSSSSKKSQNVQHLFCPIEGNTPQEKLWRALVHRYPELVKAGDLCWELGGVVPGRKYSLDIAMKDLNLGLELDGWEWHGKNIKNFKRDRQKDRLLLLSGWRVLRFFASEVIDEIESVMDVIEQARTVVSAQQKRQRHSHDHSNGHSRIPLNGGRGVLREPSPSTGRGRPKRK